MSLLVPFAPHALKRMDQRGITRDDLLELWDHGAEHHQGTGSRVLYFDKAARARLAARGLDRIARLYAVLATDGTVITVGHRYKHKPLHR